MLMGEYHHNIDDKNRLVIPTIYRKDIGDTFVITRGIEKCLYVYSMDEWEHLVSKLNELSFTKKDVRTFSRVFFSSATVCVLDSNGRVNIASSLISYAGISKKCTIIGVNDRLEIWDDDVYENYNLENASNLEAIAENLFDGITL